MSHGVPQKKQTTLGLYVTANEAYAMWQADPEHVNIIDVRTPEEYYFIGHAEMARNIPIGFVKYQWNPEKNEPVVEPNTDFLSSIQSYCEPDDIVLLICRSGGRSALATNTLAQNGFTSVYNVIDGMEGDKIDDRRLVNGWKNSGLPWTYEVNTKLLWLK